MVFRSVLATVLKVVSGKARSLSERILSLERGELKIKVTGELVLL